MNATAPYLADEPNTIRTADNTRLFYRDWGQGTPRSSSSRAGR
ncbi:hypothetical protein [Paraburkholderia sp. BL6669N2]|nr:hypothetical protein [Paraburkholderia sp. BL6669N2]